MPKKNHAHCVLGSQYYTSHHGRKRKLHHLDVPFFLFIWFQYHRFWTYRCLCDLRALSFNRYFSTWLHLIPVARYTSIVIINEHLYLTNIFFVIIVLTTIILLASLVVGRHPKHDSIHVKLIIHPSFSLL